MKIFYGEVSFFITISGADMWKKGFNTRQQAVTIWCTVVTQPPPPPTTTCSATGSISREQWDKVSGEQVSSIPVNTTFSINTSLSSFEPPVTLVIIMVHEFRRLSPFVNNTLTFRIAHKPK